MQRYKRLVVFFLLSILSLSHADILNAIDIFKTKLGYESFFSSSIRIYTNVVILLNHWSENKNDMSFGFNGGVSVCPEVPVRLTISNHFNGQKVVKAQFLPFL